MKQIALTFDDGPTEGITNQVLECLKKYDVKASFFVIGDYVTKEKEYLVKMAFDMGCEIHNHSKTHSFMDTMTKEEIQDEITYTTNRIIELTGVEPKFFRPPYIRVNDTMFEAIDLPFICGAGAEDWVPTVSSEERARKIIESATDGNIILLHDMEKNERTVKAIDTIIPTLKEQGYEFVTVSKLFESKHIVPKVHSGIVYTNVSDYKRYLK